MLKEKCAKENIMYKISNVAGLGLSQFLSTFLQCKIGSVVTIYMPARVYLYLLGFLYFSLKRADRKKIVLCLKYVLKLSLKKTHVLSGLDQDLSRSF